MRIFVSGPYTMGDRTYNINMAIMVGHQLMDIGHTPFVPHAMTFMMDLLRSRPLCAWLNYDFEWLNLCDAVFRIPGASRGADYEVQHAIKIGKPVYYHMGEVPDGRSGDRDK